jgi:hypothetical protein
MLIYFLPGNQIPGGGFLGKYHLDKGIHFTLFFVWVVLFYWSHALNPWRTKKTRIYYWYLFLIPAIALEVLQPFWASNRSFDVSDIVANIAGVGLAYFQRKQLIKKISERIQ